MHNHRPLALCVSLACATLCLTSTSAHAAPTPADPLVEIGQYRDHAQWLDALAAIERAQLRAPQDELLYKLQVLTLADIGNAYRAWQLYQARPQLFDAGQQQRLETNYLAKLAGWSLAYGTSEDTRLDEADDALARMQHYLDRDGSSAQDAPLRIRHDRLILLNRLGRHAQVRDEYRTLLAQGLPVPNYLMAAIGDSLMATEHPREAIPVLAAALQADPDAPDVRSELAYAYLESEQPEAAIALLKKWQADQPAWRWSNGAKTPHANWPRYEADLNLAMVRAYSGDLPTAQRELETMIEIAPGNTGTQSSLGNIYMMRGWPRQALERYSMANTLDPRDVPARLGQVDAYVELQRDDLARPLHDTLMQRYPGQPAVQRMERSWRAHRGWQLHAYAEGGRSAGGDGASPLGKNDGRYGVEVQSPVIDDRWRVVAFADRRSVDFQDRTIQPLRLGLGTRYRFGRADAEAFVDRANDHVGDTGLSAGVGWQFNDQWHAGITAARNAADASMQARVAGISADSVAVAVDYKRNERTHWSIGASQFRYDDGNRRDTVNTAIEQRLLTRPTLLLDGLGSAYASRGSRGDAPYFNPSEDHSVELGLRVDQQLWRHYERHFRHRLTVSVGQYWQQGYGSAIVPSAEYRHEWQFGVGRIFEYGVSWSRPVYDGQRERHIGLDVGLRWGQ